MTYLQIIEARAAETQIEINRMVIAAREEIHRRFAFLNRSRGQKKRYERKSNGR